MSTNAIDKTISIGALAAVEVDSANQMKGVIL